MLENLSPKEKELFDLLISGISPKEIAYKLNLKPSTVDYYRTKLYNKLGVHSIQELLVKYSTSSKENNPELAQSEEKITVPQTKKHKKFKFLLPIGAAIIAFSILFLFVLNTNRKPTFHTTPKGEIIPVNNLGFSAFSDSQQGGNSVSEVYVSREKIDRVSIEVLNLKTFLVKRENSDNIHAKAYTHQNDLIKRLRQANGIRFKARGDGKSWAVGIHTIESTPERNNAIYMYQFVTVRDQVVVIDIPYSSLYMPEWWEQYKFDFNRESINGLSIEANYTIQPFGSSFLQIFDFEIY